MLLVAGLHLRTGDSMFRRVIVLLAAPVLVAAGQAPARGEVQVPVSTGIVSITMSSAGYQMIVGKSNGGERVLFRSTSLPVVDSLRRDTQRLVRGSGTVSWSLPAESEVSVAATDSTATIRVELQDQGRTVAIASGRSIDLRRHGDFVSLDVRRDGPSAVAPRPPGREH